MFYGSISNCVFQISRVKSVYAERNGASCEMQNGAVNWELGFTLLYKKLLFSVVPKVT